MDKQGRQLKNLKTAMPIIFIGTTAAIFASIWIGLKADTGFIKAFASGNLTLYITALLIGFAFFFILRLIFSYISLPHLAAFGEKDLSQNASRILTGALCGITAILLLHRRYHAEFYEYPARDIPVKTFHLLPVPISLLILAGVSCLLIFILKIPEKSREIKILTGIIYAFSTLFVYYSLLCTSIDKDSGFDVYHGSAYIQSIYNSLYHVPFSKETTGVYGHYGIIYALIIRLFRLKSDGIFYLIALAGAISTLCSIYIIHSLIKSDYLRITAAISLAVPQALVYLTNYWMTYPHKTLFPMLLLAWLTFAFRHKKNHHKGLDVLYCIIAYLISAVGIVWNTETGLYCLASTAAAFIIWNWQEKKWYALPMLWRYLIHIAACVTSVFGAYEIVKFFNIWCGRKKGIAANLSLEDFFFPLGVIDSFIGSGDHADVIFGNHAWVYVLVLFILALIYTLYHTTFFRKPIEKSGDIPVIAATALMGIMHFALYFVHAAYGKLSMCLLPAVILIAYLCDQLVPNWKTFDVTGNVNAVCKKSFALISLMTLTVLSAEVLTMGPIELGLNGYWAHGKSDIHHLASLYNSVVPPDTFSIGSCVDALNYELHQESEAHYRDLSNSSLGGVNITERIVSDALEHDTFSVWLMGNGESGILARILRADPEYQLVREIDLGGYPLRLYSRAETIP